MKNTLSIVLVLALIICSLNQACAKTILPAGTAEAVSINSYHNNSFDNGLAKARKRNNDKKVVAHSTIGSIVPNAGKAGSIQIKLTIVRAELATITVFDESGKNISTQQVELLAGNSNIAVDNITTLSTGTYTVVIEIGSVKLKSQFLIW